MLDLLIALQISQLTRCLWLCRPGVAPPSIASRRAVPPPPHVDSSDSNEQSPNPPPPTPPARSTKPADDYNGCNVPEEPVGGEDEYEVPDRASVTKPSTVVAPDANPSTDQGALLGEDPDSEDEYEVPEIARRTLSTSSGAVTTPATHSDIGAEPSLDDEYEVPRISVENANLGAAAEEIVTHTPEDLYGNVLEDASEGRSRAATIEHRDRVYGKVNLTRIDEATAKRILEGCDGSCPGSYLFRVTPDQGIVLSLLQSNLEVVHRPIFQDIENGEPIVSFGPKTKHRFQALEDLRHFYKSSDMTTSRAAGLGSRLTKEIIPSKVLCSTSICCACIFGFNCPNQ